MTLLATPSDLEVKRNELVTKVLQFRVTDKNSLEEAGRLTRAIAGLQGEVRSTFDPVIESAHKAHKAALNARETHLNPLLKAEGHLKSQSRAYLLAEQEKRRQEELKRRREEEERQREEARQKAESDRKQREADELLRKAAEAEKLAAESKSQEEAASLKQQAELLFSEAVKSEPVAAHVPEPVVVSTPPPPPVTKVAGLGSRKVWKWRCTDFERVPHTYLSLNEKMLNAAASSTRPDIPGIEFYEDIEMRRSS